MTFTPTDFDESKVARDTDGKFDKKVGAGPEVTLAADQTYDPALFDAKAHEPFTDDDVLAYTVNRYGVGLEESPVREEILKDFTTEYLLKNRSRDLPRYDQSRDYYERLSAAADVRNSAELAQIALNEDEDDFYVVVANSKNVTSDTLDYVSKHNSLTVAGAVIDNPKTAESTLHNIIAMSEHDAEQARGFARTAGPMQDQNLWEAEKNEDLIARAHEALNKRA